MFGWLPYRILNTGVDAIVQREALARLDRSQMHGVAARAVRPVGKSALV